MFTGIIENNAIIKEIITNKSNKSFWLTSHLASQLKVDQSLSHNGICLTVEEIVDNQYKITAISETLQKTTADTWKVEDVINLERCIKADGRFDGHFVSGHIDTRAICVDIIDRHGSWEFVFSFNTEFAHLVIEKGSIAVNGISLTVFNVTNLSFSVAIIPYTYENTNIKYIKVQDEVNIEFDIIGKYIHRKTSLQ